MLTLPDIRARLEALRGTGDWRRIADEADCHYLTLARIVRGEITDPSVNLCERLSDALQAAEQSRAKLGAAEA